MYVKGAENRPTRKASEKFRVASEERKRPSSSRENDLMSEYCWVVGWKVLAKNRDRTGGAIVLSTVKRTKIEGSI
jgi:hypothetical protein